VRLEAVAAVFTKHTRAWQRRGWWLPVPGALMVIVPLCIFRPPSWEEVERARQGAAFAPFHDDLFSPVHGPTIMVVTSALMTLTTLLAMVLTALFRHWEIRTATLCDLAMTPLTALEITVGQALAAAAPPTMLLVGAVPILVMTGVVTGRHATEVLANALFVLLLPTVTAASLTFLSAYRIGAKALERGYSSTLAVVVVGFGYLVFMTLFGSLFSFRYIQGIVTELGALTASASHEDRIAVITLGVVLHTGAGFFVGLLLLNVTLLAARGLLACWHHGWRGCFVFALVVLILAILVRYSVVEVAAGLSGLTGNMIVMPGGIQKLLLLFSPFLSIFSPALAFGGHVAMLSELFRPLFAPGLIILSWFMLAYAAQSISDGVRDFDWLLRHPAAIDLLRNPRAALESNRRPRKRRLTPRECLTWNPVFEYEASKAREPVTAFSFMLGLLLFGGVPFMALIFSGYEQELPVTKDFTAPLLAFMVGVSAVFVAIIGLVLGGTIATWRRNGWWNQLLMTSLTAPAIVWGVAKPLFGAAILVAMMTCALVPVAIVFHEAEWWQLGALFAGFILIAVGCGAYALFAASLGRHDRRGWATLFVALLFCWLVPVTSPLLARAALRRLAVEETDS